MEQSSGDDHMPKLSRVGTQYQADVPKFVPIAREALADIPRTDDLHESPRSLCTLIWKKPHRESEEVSTYLRKISGMMTTPHRLDTEMALHLLMLKDYNSRRALTTIQRAISGSLQTEGAPALARGRTRARKKTENESNRSNRPEVEHCFVCKHGGTVLLCDGSECERLFHPECAGLAHIPDDDFFCARHKCALCDSSSLKSLQCCLCSISYCATHRPAAHLVTQASSGGFQCMNCSKKAPERQKFVLQCSKWSPEHSWPSFRGHKIDLWVLSYTVQLLKLNETSSDHELGFVARHLGFVTSNSIITSKIRAILADDSFKRFHNSLLRDRDSAGQVRAKPEDAKRQKVVRRDSASPLRKAVPLQGSLQVDSTMVATKALVAPSSRASSLAHRAEAVVATVTEVPKSTSPMPSQVSKPPVIPSKGHKGVAQTKKSASGVAAKPTVSLPISVSSRAAALGQAPNLLAKAPLSAFKTSPTQPGRIIRSTTANRLPSAGVSTTNVPALTQESFRSALSSSVSKILSTAQSSSVGADVSNAQKFIGAIKRTPSVPIPLSSIPSQKIAEQSAQKISLQAAPLAPKTSASARSFRVIGNVSSATASAPTCHAAAAKPASNTKNVPKIIPSEASRLVAVAVSHALRSKSPSPSPGSCPPSRGVALQHKPSLVRTGPTPPKLPQTALPDAKGTFPPQSLARSGGKRKNLSSSAELQPSGRPSKVPHLKDEPSTKSSGPVRLVRRKPEQISSSHSKRHSPDLSNTSTHHQNSSSRPQPVHSQIVSAASAAQLGNATPNTQKVAAVPPFVNPSQGAADASSVMLNANRRSDALQL